MTSPPKEPQKQEKQNEENCWKDLDGSNHISAVRLNFGHGLVDVDVDVNAVADADASER